MAFPSHASEWRRRRWLMAALLLVALCVSATSAEGAGRKAGVAVLGGLESVRPDCPSTPARGCQAIGRVTGFQTGAGHRDGLFRVPFLGKVVAWSLNVARPKRSEVVFFNRFFGGRPKARIAILRRVPGAKLRFKLVRQGPTRLLSPYRGRRVTFAVEDPLWARRGDIVALTFPTWAPVLATGGGGRWLGSRHDGACVAPADQKAGHPQQLPGSVRGYGCAYRGGRLTYSATVAKARKKVEG